MASKNINFETIPSSIRVPGVYTEYNTKLAVSNLPVNPQKVMIIAAMLATGAANALAPTQIFSDTQAAELFGQGSQAHVLARQAIRNNGYINLYVVGVKDEAASVKSSATIAITGTAAKQGIVKLYLGDMPYYAGFAKADSASDVATALAKVINNSPDCVVSAEASAGNITLTAKNGGEHGNELGVVVNSSDKALTAETTQFTGGQLNANITDALDAIAGDRYHLIVSNFNDLDNAKRLREHVANVSNSIEQRGCVGIMGSNASLATTTTLTNELNDGRLTVPWLKHSRSTGAMIATAYAAVVGFEEDPARPLNTLQLKGLHQPNIEEKSTFSEFNTALYNGVTPIEVVNGRVQIMRAISTYTKNATGTDDPSLLDITTIRTLDYVRDAINQRLNLRFPREKLSEKTPPKVRSEIFDVLLKLEELEIVERVEQNKGKLIIERDLQDANRLNAAIPADVVNGLHVMANRIDLYL